MYRLTLHAYCGMTVPLVIDESRAEAREAAARRIQHARRRGFPVATLERGRRWEVMEPEACAMVPDSCGELTLRHITYECAECGCEQETKEDARACCADDFRPNYSEDFS